MVVNHKGRTSHILQFNNNFIVKNDWLNWNSDI